ncbi:DUF3784 domain-containing protein [Acutalibacter caecimuris]|uniref:DUF3784 domain-containing protein n=1 Tax=Acutalibacter caecimuris TaxID=3093657 RepID=UPI002AC9CCCF|nr:DUF3784 domain-containing protein [Acutalibacter sp. M00118]
MAAKDLLGLAIFAFVFLSLIGLSIPLMLGKGTWLIAGYNTMSAEERAQWDGPALAKFTGKILLAIGIASLLYGLGLFLFGLEWLTWAYLAVVVGLSIFALIYCNTGNRFKK